MFGNRMCPEQHTKHAISYQPKRPAPLSVYSASGEPLLRMMSWAAGGPHVDGTAPKHTKHNQSHVMVLGQHSRRSAPRSVV